MDVMMLQLRVAMDRPCCCDGVGAAGDCEERHAQRELQVPLKVQCGLPQPYRYLPGDRCVADSHARCETRLAELQLMPAPTMMLMLMIA